MAPGDLAAGGRPPRTPNEAIVYGRHRSREVIAEAVRIIEIERGQTAELAECGFEPWVRFAAHGDLEAFAAEAVRIREHASLLLG